MPKEPAELRHRMLKRSGTSFSPVISCGTSMQFALYDMYRLVHSFVMLFIAYAIILCDLYTVIWSAGVAVLAGGSIMRKLVSLILLVVGTAPPALASKHVTIAQLEQILDTLKGKSDSRLAGELTGLELTERASSMRLNRWEHEFPGRHAHEAFTLLADASVFLDLPAEDIPNIPAPDNATRLAIFEKAIAYARDTITKLPNFFATRETTRFDDSPPRPPTEDGVVIFKGGKIAVDDLNTRGMTGDKSQDRPFYFAGRSSMVVTYRDGAEVMQSQTGNTSSRENPPIGLTTRGEFGPILTVVLSDAARSSVTWGYWEQGDMGRFAVFRYAVPEEHSHYEVMMPNGRKLARLLPAYHGEIVVDSTNGTIMRLSAISNFKAPFEQALAAILVEYAPVAIGDRTHVCPVKGVALSKMPTLQGETKSETAKVPPLRTELNEVAFIHYHLFHTQMRILEDR